MDSGLSIETEDDAGRHCTYLLTIRRVQVDEEEAKGFRDYFHSLAAAGCDVLVVDGSPQKVFAAHDAVWRGDCRHARVDPRYTYLNGKVNGIHTGVDLALHERIILADDDIRYTPEDVERMNRLLDRFEMVRPQNYLRPLSRRWWARMESARMLINRACLKAGDYPGTLGVRRSAMRRVGHYDGDVLFDNEEIVRHFRLHRASIAYATDFFILKRPPTFRKWLEQRPRQAYEDFVMRAKTVFFMLLPPAFVFTIFFASWFWLLALTTLIVCGSVLVASRGLKNGAARFFPPWLCLYAPLWIAERAVSVYWALYWRTLRGGYPFGDKLLTKGTGRAWNVGARAPLTSVSDEIAADKATRHRHETHSV